LTHPCRAPLCRRRAAAQRPPAQLAARLLRAETALSEHSTAAAAQAREVAKLQVRARVLGRDLRQPLAALRAQGAEAAGLLADAAARLDKVEGDVRDVEALVGAVQGLAAKQFELLAGVVRRQRQPRPAAGAPQQQAAAAPPQQAVQARYGALGEESAPSGEASSTDEWGRQVLPAPRPAAGPGLVAGEGEGA
jgi:hypothetical protein